MKKIEITIDETGEVAVDLSGFHGKGCQKVLEDFAGDAKLIKSTVKREFYENVQEKEKQKL